MVLSDKLPAFSSSFTPRRPRQLAIIGGRLEADNRAVFDALKQKSQGRIAVFATASEIPDEVGGETVEDFTRYGFEAELIPLFHNNSHQAAFDEALIARVQRLGSVYFTGGDQARIIKALLGENGAGTPMLEVLQHLHAQGGLVAGSSAGAAMMPERIILRGTSLEALVDGINDGDGAVADDDHPRGLILGPGLGFFPWGLVDQHFIKRGRLGRLVVALGASSHRLGFGVDENTAMLVEDQLITVVGETGVVVVDVGNAQIDATTQTFDNVRLSYLDHGDRYDLKRHRPQAAPDKKRIRVDATSFTQPAPYRRNAFGSYALHEMLIRLLHGDPKHYAKDTAMAYASHRETEVVVELQRIHRHSRALSCERDGERRYSAFNFHLNITCKRLARSDWRDLQLEISKPLLQNIAPAPEARLVVLGSSPLRGSERLAVPLLQMVAEPVGVIAAAAHDPQQTAREYCYWFQDQGLDDVEDLGITVGNIETRGCDPAVLATIAAKRTLVFTGGNQRRLVEALLFGGEVTPTLQAVVHAYQRGATLVAVGGAASAFCARMIAEGNSRDALRYGASGDAGHEGMVIEEGFGLFNLGIVDQNFIARRRLGRLIVACASENARYGFGLCEDSGMVLFQPHTPIYAFGRAGLVVAALDLERLDYRNDRFRAEGVRLHWVRPNEAFDPLKGKVVDAQSPRDAAMDVGRMVRDLACECGATVVNGSGLQGAEEPKTRGQDIHLTLRHDEGLGCELAIESPRYY